MSSFGRTLQVSLFGAHLRGAADSTLALKMLFAVN